MRTAVVMSVVTWNRQLPYGYHCIHISVAQPSLTLAISEQMLIVEYGDKPAGMVDQEGVETAALAQEIYNEDDKAQVQVKDPKIPVVLHYDPRLCEKRVRNNIQVYPEVWAQVTSTTITAATGSVRSQTFLTSEQ